MKAASLSLKILAILAAAFCVFAWVDTRGKVSTATTNMIEVEGITLVEKSEKIPALLKSNADLKVKVDNLDSRIKTLETRESELNKELEGERTKNLQVNAELTKKNGEIRTLNTSLDTAKKQITEKESTIETLRREIIDAKNMAVDTGDVEALNAKVADLESQLAAKAKEASDAQAKVKLLESGEVIEVVETDAQGNKVVKKVAKVPYVATGDIATVLDVDQPTAMVKLNRGKSAGLQQGQKILLKREGRLVAEILVDIVADSTAVAFMNTEKGIPETVEVGDLLEMADAPVEAPKAAAPVISAPVEEAAPVEEEAPADDAGLGDFPEPDDFDF